MNKKVWAGIFFLALLSELVCIQYQFIAASYITKPLLMLILIGYFLWQGKGFTHPVKSLIVLALCFSWIGDVLLLFENKGALFFILGLSSFLVAHLFYCYAFHSIRVKESIPFNPLLFVPVAIFYVALIGLLHPHLGVMKLPVYLYGLVICMMLFLAIHLYKTRVNNSGRFIVIGAILFILSDSALAINKFYAPYTGAGIIIMLTYGLAQWCIVEGSIKWLQGTMQQRPLMVMNSV